jgi:ribosome-binding factor A
MNERRVHRLESMIKAKVASVLVRDMSDPRLGLVTVTRVELDRELTLCKVFWSVLGGEKERRVNERVLRHAGGWVRREIADILHTRTVPRVQFVFDERIAGAVRVDQILKGLREERAARGEDDDQPDDSAEAPPEPGGPPRPDDRER